MTHHSVAPRFIPYSHSTRSPEEMLEQSAAHYAEMQGRRTVRDFSDRPVPRAVIENCIKTAGTAQSGANLQPWHFVAVQEPSIKRDIRQAAEKEERAFYNGKAPQEWLDALAPLGTDADKPFLETAPWLLAIFQQRYGELPDGRRVKHYYATESVGIATGFLINALHLAGLVCLTHTPSPMGFLRELLGRPRSERPFLLLVTGYPAAAAKVPEITKKSLSEIATFIP